MENGAGAGRERGGASRSPRRRDDEPSPAPSSPELPFTRRISDDEPSPSPSPAPSSTPTPTPTGEIELPFTRWPPGRPSPLTAYHAFRQHISLETERRLLMAPIPNRHRYPGLALPSPRNRDLEAQALRESEQAMAESQGRGRGISENIIALLPTFAHDSSRPMKYAHGGCPICCFDYLHGDFILSLIPCKHLYHYECIAPWFKQSQVCPCCKHVITGEEDQDQDKDKDKDKDKKEDQPKD